MRQVRVLFCCHSSPKRRGRRLVRNQTTNNMRLKSFGQVFFCQSKIKCTHLCWRVKDTKDSSLLCSFLSVLFSSLDQRTKKKQQKTPNSQQNKSAVIITNQIANSNYVSVPTRKLSTCCLVNLTTIDIFVKLDNLSQLQSWVVTNFMQLVPWNVTFRVRNELKKGQQNWNHGSCK
jgi:hypothetical protein